MCGVICRAVDGPSSNDAWTDQSASTGAGIAMLMALASSTVNIGWVWRRYTASLPPRGGPSSTLTCTTVTEWASTRGTATSMWRGAVSTTSCMSAGTQGRLGTVSIIIIKWSSPQGIETMTTTVLAAPTFMMEVDGGSRVALDPT